MDYPLTVGAQAGPVVADPVRRAPLVARPPLAPGAGPTLGAAAAAGLAGAVGAAVEAATL